MLVGLVKRDGHGRFLELPVFSSSCTDLSHKVQLCSIFEPVWPEVADKASPVLAQVLNSCLSDVAECS